MSIVMLLVWGAKRQKYTLLRWRWSIPLISVGLMLSDYLFAVSQPESLISILSALRRGGLVVAFAFGALVLKEKNIKTKGVFLIGILAGIICIALGSV